MTLAGRGDEGGNGKSAVVVRTDCCYNISGKIWDGCIIGVDDSCDVAHRGDG